MLKTLCEFPVIYVFFPNLFFLNRGKFFGRFSEPKIPDDFLPPSENFSFYWTQFFSPSRPQAVDFNEASVLKCLERRGQPLLAVEPWMEGNFSKYSNNYGFVSYDDRGQGPSPFDPENR